MVLISNKKYLAFKIRMKMKIHLIPETFEGAFYEFDVKMGNLPLLPVFHMLDNCTEIIYFLFSIFRKI